MGFVLAGVHRFAQFRGTRTAVFVGEAAACFHPVEVSELCSERPEDVQEKWYFELLFFTLIFLFFIFDFDFLIF